MVDIKREKVRGIPKKVQPCMYTIQWFSKRRDYYDITKIIVFRL